MSNIQDRFSFFTDVSDRLTEGVLLYDLNSDTVQYINTVARNITGLEKNDDLNKVIRLWQQIAIQDRAYLSARYDHLRRHGETQNVEFSLMQNGSEKQIHVMASLTDQSFLILYIRDITQVRQHEDYLVEFGAKKNTLLETLTHNLSGSLNLTRQLAAQAEKQATQAGTDLQRILALISENNEGCLKIIEDFLVYEHEKSPRIYIKASRIDLIEKIDYVYQQLQHSYPDRIFRLIPSRPEIHVTTDEVKLLQIVNNLVSNAIKFSRSHDPVDISVTAISDGVVISVADYGIGIPDSIKPRIFLHQPDTGRTGLQGEPSNGKGLAISKHLVEMLEGPIWFESQEQAGTTFFIRLPYSVSVN